MAEFLKKRYCILLPVFITALAVLTGFVRFIVNDDTAMMNIAESFNSNPYSEHLVFMSVIIGYVLKFLYSLISVINWFVLIELFALNLAFCALFYINKHYGDSIFGVIALSGYLIFFLSNLTFTSVSLVCACTAMLWLYVFADKLNKKTLKHFIFAFALFALASLIRVHGTMVVIGIVTALLLAVTVLKKQKSVAVLITAVVMILSVNYAVIYIQNEYNAAIPTETYFTQFSKYRSAVSDGGFYDYGLHKEELDEKGISKNDFDLISKWVYADKNAFSAEKFKAVSELRTFNEKYNTHIFSTALYIFKTSPLICITALLALFLLIKLKKKRLEIILTFGAFFGAEGYLCSLYRDLSRICDALTLCADIVILIIFIQNRNEALKIKRIEPKRAKRISLTVCAVFIALLSILNIWQAEYQPGYWNDIAEYTEENNGVTYIYDSFTMGDYYKTEYSKNILRSKQGIITYRITLGGWTIYSPFWYNNLEKNGLSDYSDSLISALLKDGVYYVDATVPPENIVKFFDEHYGKKVEYEVIKTFEKQNDDVNIYNFYEVN